MPTLEDEIKALQQHIAELEKALRPVADWNKTIYAEQPDSDICDMWLEAGQIRHAAEVLGLTLPPEERS